MLIALSWLLAEPATMRHFSSGSVSSRMIPPSAHGANMSHSTAWILSGSAVSTRNSRTTRATASTSTSDTTISAPASRRCFTSQYPTFPTPCTATFFPASEDPSTPPRRTR